MSISTSALGVSKEERAKRNAQKPCVLWLTGLPGAGKSSIANLVDQMLHARGHSAYVLDGDIIRSGLNRDLSFSLEDRIENMRRIREVAKLMLDAGHIVVVSTISPFRAEREKCRASFADKEFIEVFVDAPLEVVMERDPKGLYKKARSGELPDFTGIDSPYEPPTRPEIHIFSSLVTPGDAAEEIIDYLAAKKYI